MTNPTKPVGRTRVACLAGLFLSLSLPFAQAEDVFVTSYKGATTSADAMSCPPSCRSAQNVSTSGSSASSSCTPAPYLPASDRRLIYGLNITNSAGDPLFWSVQPLDASYTSSSSGKTYNFTSLQHVPGVYKIYVTRGSGTTTHSTNLTLKMTVDSGQLADTNGVGGSQVIFPFTRSSAVNSWIPVGYITNNTASPVVTFTYNSGNIDNSNNRWNMDAVYFQYIDACAPNGVPVAPQVTVAGPLAAGQNFVNVSGVTAGATNISVFANGGIIGTTNFAAGFPAGIVTVSTTALIKNDDITASQTVSNCTSSLPGAGIDVGGGANPSISVMMSCSRNATLTGPAGANGSLAASGFPYVVGADHVASGFNSAPLPGTVLQPGTCWQTATFTPSTDSAIDINSDTPVANDSNPFCALEGLVFSMDALDSGPYDIYIGRIVNGDTVIEDFQSYAVGVGAGFTPATGSATFAPPSNFLPNSAFTAISTNHAYAGTKSLRLQWQWVNAGNQRWTHILANGTGGGKVYPQLDTTKPTTIYYLVLPVGSSSDTMHFSTAPANQSKSVGQTATLTAAVAGPGTFSYQWSKSGSNLTDGGNVAGSQTAALTLSNLALGDAGTYTLTVTEQGGTGCVGSVQAAVSVNQFVAPSALSFTWTAPSSLSLTWSAGVLQSAGPLLSSGTVWTDVPSATSPYTVPLSATAKYYRVRGQ